LTRIVKGYPLNGENIFPLMNRIVSELFPLICEYSQGKPTLVFVPTRNLCIKAAASLAKAYETALESGRRLPWSNHGRPKLSCDSKPLEEYSACGIAFHHGGLSLDDRRKVETAFRSGKIMVIVATSTLAVGVNLPARTVILAGTYQWSGSGMIDLSDLDVQQMIGRAGRPQYDTEGTAVILCSEKNQGRYRDLLNSSTTIESCLQDHLIEHINTEIGLRTITCLQEGEEWIRNSFLYVRIQQNPRHYSAILSAAGAANHQWESALTRLVEKAVEDLQGKDMVEIQESNGTPEPPELCNMSSTIYGETMSSSCLSFKTMCSILDIPAKSSLETLLHVLSNAHEYADLKLRNGEKVFYKSLAKDADMRFQLPNGAGPSTAAHKVFLIVQMTLGNVDCDPYKEQLKQGASGPALDSYQVFRMAPRICKAMATVALQKEDGETLKNALQLTRIVSGKAWPGTSVIFRQIDAIGAKSIKVLASKGITSFRSLARTDPPKIEMLLNRQTGFGNKIVAAAKAFPVFNVIIEQETQVTAAATAPVDIHFRVAISVEGSLVESSKKKHAQSRTISVLALLSDGTYVAFRKANVNSLRAEDLTMTLPARIQYSNQKFQVVVGLDQVSGCSTQVDFKPEVPDGILESPVTNGVAKIEDQEDVKPAPSETRPLPPPPQQDDERDELASSGAEEDAKLSRLPNGNWPCSHSCADKRACKHKCCKEGTKKKPKSGLKKALAKDLSVQETVSRGDGRGVKNELSPGPSDLPAPKKTQAKKNRSRRKIPATGSKVIDLCEDSEPSSTEDEKDAVGRILEGTQKKENSRKRKRLRLADTDSDEFNDPSFDDALQNVDMDRITGPTSKSAKITSRLDKVGTKDIARKNSLLPMRERLPSTSAGIAGKKGNRPQPIRRVRATSGTEDLTEQERAEARLTDINQMDCEPDHEDELHGLDVQAQFVPAGPLFMYSDDDADHQEDLGKRRMVSLSSRRRD
jgi:ATP-dependent DNA helicase HFM1/MER3